MAVRPELRVRLANSPGALARVAAVLSAERVRILALALDSSGLLRLVVDNPLHAAAALTEAHLAVQQHDVIYTTVGVKSVHALLQTIAGAGVNIEYAYASASDVDGLVALVIGVDDAQRAAYAAGV